MAGIMGISLKAIKRTVGREGDVSMQLTCIRDAFMVSLFLRENWNLIFLLEKV